MDFIAIYTKFCYADSLLSDAQPHTVRQRVGKGTAEVPFVGLNLSGEILRQPHVTDMLRQRQDRPTISDKMSELSVRVWAGPCRCSVYRQMAAFVQEKWERKN